MGRPYAKPGYISPETVEHGILGTTKVRGNYLELVEARGRLIDPGLNNNIRCGVGPVLRRCIILLLEYHPGLC